MVGAVRAGLAVLLHSYLDMYEGTCFSQAYRDQAVSIWSRCQHIHILADDNAASTQGSGIPVVSFVISASKAALRYAKSKNSGKEKVLHPRFLAALLSDMYGIQVAVGTFNGDNDTTLLSPLLSTCGVDFQDLKAHVAATSFQSHRIACALDAPSSKTSQQRADHRCKVRQPVHWAQACCCTVHFSHERNPEQVAYAIEAVKNVADHGWKMLPQYSMDATGTWPLWRACV